MTKSIPTHILEGLESIIPGSRIFSQAERPDYFSDESHAMEPNGSCVVFPETTEEVQALVQWANDKNMAIVPSGGRTGLSGGAIAADGEVVISLDHMNKVTGFDEFSGSMTVQAGMTIEQLQKEASMKGWFYPVDYPSKSSAQVGGAVATNAGGLRVLRYGMTRNWVLGLKAVLGNGELLSFETDLVKDNTGYDLKQLLIGSEGTLGIITEVCLQLTQPMAIQKTVLIAMSSIDDALKVFSNLYKGVQLSAAELFCLNAMEIVTHQHNISNPFGESAQGNQYYLLCEYDESSLDDESLLEYIGDNECVIAHSETQKTHMWKIRELISSTLNPHNPYKNDIACHLRSFPEWFHDISLLLMPYQDRLKVVWFGHLGDGNMHINILPKDGFDLDSFTSIIELIEPEIIGITHRYRGSISAEHGIGILKKNHMSQTKSAVELALAREVKKLCDPKGILNPGKLLP